MIVRALAGGWAAAPVPRKRNGPTPTTATHHAAGPDRTHNVPHACTAPQVKIYLTDFSGATNLLPRFDAPGADPLMLDTIWGNGTYANFPAGVLPCVRASVRACVRAGGG